ncbi:MAG: endonuclease [Bacteroidales bacterium]|nr:endonuclease [Bacteroidales bacterium]
MENFFDWKRDTVLSSPSEEEFTSFGKRHWTKAKFQRKCHAVAKTILWVSDKRGSLPDVIGLAEVENRFVLEKLLSETILRRLDYSIIHYDSPDPRGIDVALLYRKTKLKQLGSKQLRVYSGDGPPLLTRDILFAGFETPGGDSVAVIVNHHPSKYGDDSSWRRVAAMTRLSEITDSLMAGGFRNIVAMGDFNDTPESTKEYSGKMRNLAAPLAAKGLGTIKYSGRWEMIDMFFVSPAIVRKASFLEMSVETVSFLMVRDNTHSGEKPLRTYTGPRYTGGVSDHCPITLVIR